MTLSTVLPLFVYELYMLYHHLYPCLWGRGHRKPTIQRAKKMGQHTEGIVLAFSLLTSEAAFSACQRELLLRLERLESLPSEKYRESLPREEEPLFKKPDVGRRERLETRSRSFRLQWAAAHQAKWANSRAAF